VVVGEWEVDDVGVVVGLVAIVVLVIIVVNWGTRVCTSVRLGSLCVQFIGVTIRFFVPHKCAMYNCALAPQIHDPNTHISTRPWPQALASPQCGTGVVEDALRSSTPFWNLMP
jgi:hypothetical protein